jgi:3'-phosphoadenosine 5'-phosphosulfate sulfotransferase (PAPS reductase)/FAD synthetase
LPASFDPTAERIIREAVAAHPRSIIAFSGGLDSLTLVDFVSRFTPYRLPLLWVDPGVSELATTEPFIRETADRYRLPLHVVRTETDPLSQWEKHGFPMLGKEAAVKWSKAHKGFGFRLDCSGCCKRRKITPARRWMKANGFTCQLVATRRADSNSRDLRAQKDGSIHQVDDITVAKPIEAWTDLRSRVYRKRYSLLVHPDRAAGRVTNIGCQSCGGGSQFVSSNFREMRLSFPDLWYQAIVDRGLGPVILSVKFSAPIVAVRRAIAAAGGLEHLATSRPHVFDFSRVNPLPSYRR